MLVHEGLNKKSRRMQCAYEEVISYFSLPELLSMNCGETLLHIAAKKGNSDDCWMLLRHGEETECKAEMLTKVNSEGRTALQIACDQGNLLVVHTLLNDGATWVCRDAFVDHPFMLACMKGHWNICTMLLQHNSIALTILFTDKFIAEAILQQAVYAGKSEFVYLALEYDGRS